MKSLIVSGYSPEHDVSGVSDPFLQVRLEPPISASSSTLHIVSIKPDCLKYPKCIHAQRCPSGGTGADPEASEDPRPQPRRCQRHHERPPSSGPALTFTRERDGEPIILMLNWLLGSFRWPPTPTAPRPSATLCCMRPFSPSWTSNLRAASG